MKIIAKILLRDKDGDILALTRSSTHPAYPNELDFPGGEVDFGENILDAIKREVKEETGIDISNLNPKIVMDNLVSDNTRHVLYTLKLKHSKPPIKLSYEHSIYHWVKPDDIFVNKKLSTKDDYFQSVLNAVNNYDLT